MYPVKNTLEIIICGHVDILYRGEIDVLTRVPLTDVTLTWLINKVWYVLTRVDIISTSWEINPREYYRI